MVTTTEIAPGLPKRVHDMVAQYVNRKTEQRCGIKWEDFKDQRVKDPGTGRERVAVPPAYREARQKVCEDAFLAMRSRKTREDFAAYFVGTLCAVPQYLPESDYFALASGLLTAGDQWQEVKALAMLTVSSLMSV